MGTWGSYSFLVGPIIALLAVGGLLLVARWMSAGRPSLIEEEARPGSQEEYGLMIPVASPRDAGESDRMTGRLAAAGVRARVVQTTDGRRVMVWAEDVARARAVLDPPAR